MSMAEVVDIHTVQYSVSDGVEPIWFCPGGRADGAWVAGVCLGRDVRM